MHAMDPDIAHRYRQALGDYIAGDGETALHSAYELGREALASGMGLLELVSIHHSAVLALTRDRPVPVASINRRLEAAGRFLVECLSPFEMLQIGNQETTAALRRLNEILETEARRIAHVLHDEAAQLLASVYLELAEILREAPPEPIRARVDKITSHLDQVREQLLRLSHELRPPILDQLGLLPALEFLADGFRKRAKLEVVVDGGSESRLPPLVETALYRTVQEALNNVVRHAHAQHVDIQLWTEKSTVYCTVKDDGVGFEPAMAAAGAGGHGLGLLGIRERLSSLHGTLNCKSAPNHGAELSITIPLGSNS
jgi:signal transduction histidine kinase